MSITAYNVETVGNVATVTVTSDLAGVVYFHWYLDGVYQGQTAGPSRSFFTADAEQARVDVVDTTDADFDPVAGAPDRPPSRRTVWWVRSMADDVAAYRVEQNRAAAGWETVATVPHVPGRWAYSLITDRLDDLTAYQWRVVPVDTAGNDGTPATIDAETVVRTPDAPTYAISFDEGTTEVTFAAA